MTPLISTLLPTGGTDWSIDRIPGGAPRYGSGAALRNGEIACEKHEAYFETGFGYCNFGSREGVTLEEIEVTVEEGIVYLADDRYGFETLGPAAARNPSSGSRIGFPGS